MNHARAQESRAASDLISVEVFLRILRAQWRKIALIAALCVTGTLAHETFRVPNYTAQSVLLIVKPKETLGGAFSNLLMSELDSTGLQRQYTYYLGSYDFFKSLAESLRAQPPDHHLDLTPPSKASLMDRGFWTSLWKRYFRDRTTAALQIAEPPRDDINALRELFRPEIVGTELRLKAVTYDAYTSMTVANEAANVLIQKMTSREHADLTQVHHYLEAQLATAASRLKQKEGELVKFKNHNGALALGSEQSALIKSYDTIELELNSAQSKLQQTESLIALQQKVLRANEKSLNAQVYGQDPQDALSPLRVAFLQRELDMLQGKKNMLLAQGLPETSSELLGLNQEIHASVEALKRLKGGNDATVPEDETIWIQNPSIVRQELDSRRADRRRLKTQIEALETSKANLLNNVSGLPLKQQALVNLEHDVSLQYELYSTLQRKLQEVLIQKAAIHSNLSILDRAVFPSADGEGGLPRRVFFSFLVGAFLGSVLVLIREIIGNRVQEVSELDRLGLFNLGTVPRVQLPTGPVNRKNLLVCDATIETPASIAIQHVRAQLDCRRKPDGTDRRTITVTSSGVEDGKSFIAANLAVSYARLGKKTLLIDCDFRRPAVHQYFSCDNRLGIGSILLQKAPPEQCLIRVEGHPKLTLIPSEGPVFATSNLFSSARLEVLLKFLASIYDRIIIDAPPALAVVDALYLASLSDEVILTIACGQSSRRTLALTLDRLRQITSCPIDAVFNFAPCIDKYHPYYCLPPSGDRRSRVVPGDEELLVFQHRLQNLFARESELSYLRRHSLLIADDDPAFLTALKSILSPTGAKLLFARDGEEALKLLRERANDVDLVLLDVSMPKKNGLETFAETRKLASPPKILFSTACPDQGVTALLRPGHVDVISKPYERETLLEKLEGLLRVA